jgi:outer membrane receptor protein involved in Fe transport
VLAHLYVADAAEPLESGYWRSRDRTSHRFGVGDGLRVHITDWMYLKAAYELATRLPSPNELFGDGRRILANLELVPEHSHNSNLSFVVHDLTTRAGTLKLGATGFDRRVRNLITPPQIGGDGQAGASAIHQNVDRVRATGFELVGGWQAPRDYVAVQANLSWQEMRNQSKRGAAAPFDGDRVPNLPYLFSNLSVRGALSDVVDPHDTLSLTYYMRYVHEFDRFWESAGISSFRQSVPGQLSHTLALTYLIQHDKQSYSLSMEVQNLTDAALFDEYGVQRPGRGSYFKLSVDR